MQHMVHATGRWQGTQHPLHYEIWMYCQSTSRVQAQVLQKKSDMNGPTKKSWEKTFLQTSFEGISQQFKDG